MIAGALGSISIVAKGYAGLGLSEANELVTRGLILLPLVAYRRKLFAAFNMLSKAPEITNPGCRILMAFSNILGAADRSPTEEVPFRVP
ncbi:uncharacterized protein RCC_04479 [Ramularia collo-cygni]|uniref:Uncharacterized protein n=1 Tax=Ramularia collo-cygni TaxID=112498 RepID=A0A2D3UWI8_9PEZI|nr:uncharacterized protein RCC_04479 [Ramularia collo-cygni]CZT18635.1 uncharacterized protein RCC_04479 [Ramularia collo-cygni]